MVDRKKIRLFDYEKPDLVFFLIIFLLALFFFVPGLRPGQILLPFPDGIYSNPDEAHKIPTQDAFPVGSDVNLEFQPWNDYACERLNNGEIPFWNPYNLCGAPFFANSLNQLTYVPRILFSLLLAPENVLTALAFIHFILCGFGFFYFLKAYDVKPIAAGLAAFLLLFKFSHPTVMMMPPQALTLAYAPLCLLIAIKLIRGGRWIFTLYLATCLSCIISSGYPVFAVHFIYFGIGLIIFEYLKMKKSGDDIPKNGILKIITGLVLAVLFSLTQLLPLALFYSLSARPAISRQLLMHFHFNFSHTVFIIFQEVFDNYRAGYITQNAAGSFSNLYLGIIPIFIALPFYSQWRRKAYSFFMIATAIAGILCFSTTAFHAAMKLIPGFGLSPVPPLPVLFFCLIAAMGFSLDWLLKPVNALSTRKAFLIMGVIALFIIILFVIHFATDQIGIFATELLLITGYLAALAIGIVRRYSGSTKPLVLVVCITFAMTFIPLMSKWTTFYSVPDSFSLKCAEYRDLNEPAELNTPRYYNATGTSFLSANTNIYPRIRIAQGYDSLVLENYADYYREHIPNGIRRERRFVTLKDQAPEPFLKEAGIGKVILNPKDAVEGHYEKLYGTDLHILDVQYPECTISSGYCEMTRISPERIEIAIETDKKATLKIAETYYPAWHYRLDSKGKTLPVQLDETSFMVIPNIPSGTEVIELTYNPSRERLGLILSIAAFIIGLILIVRIDRKE